jgi:hypothetical protein
MPARLECVRHLHRLEATQYYAMGSAMDVYGLRRCSRRSLGQCHVCLGIQTL